MVAAMADPHTKLQFGMIRQLADDNNLTVAALRIGLKLVDRLRRKDDPATGIKAGHVGIGHTAIERITGIPERTVARACVQLRERNHFAVDTAPWKGLGPGRGHVNIYRPIFHGEPQGSLFDLGAEDTAQKRPNRNREKTSPVAPFSAMVQRNKRRHSEQEKTSPVACKSHQWHVRVRLSSV